MALTVNSLPRYKGLSGSSPQLQDSTIADDGTTVTVGRDVAITGDVTATNLSGTNTGDVGMAGTPDYITISGQTITRGSVDMAADVTGVLPRANGGTGVSSAPTGGQLLIGQNAGTFTLAQLTAGANIIITNDDGAISIESTAAGAGGGANSDITSMTGLTGVLQAPTQVNDSSGNEVLKFASAASAVNELTITNAATGNPTKLDASGGDTNISILITPKGSGTVQIAGSSTLIQANNTNADLDLRPNGTGNVTVGDGTDTTKEISFEVSGATTAKTCTIASSHTDNRTITLPNATDTLVGKATTDTLTNKRITKRVVTTTDDATAVIDVDATDVYELSAVANATTFSTTGTPTDGQDLIIRFKDAGVAKGLTWDAVFVAIGVTAPTTTVAGKWHYVGATYNSAASKWHILATGVQA